MIPFTSFGRRLAILGLVLLASVKAWAQDVVTGSLPNGLGYTLVPLPRSSDISVRLLLKAGSLDEGPDEHGYAHFIEDLAFAETRDFPAGSLVQTLQRLGVSSGADLNARTSHNYTAYLIDLGEAHRDELDTALKVLRNYADGIVFTAESVSLERAIILSERRARDVPMQRVGQQLRSAIYAGTPMATHEPIGTVASIEGATPERLQAAYQRLYRPDRMTIVVTGNIAADDVVAKISAQFDSIPARPPEPARESILPPNGTGIHVLTHPVDMQVGISNLVATVRRDADSATGRQLERLQTLAVDILDRRLLARRATLPAQFTSASARLMPSPAARIDHANIEVQGPAGRWENSLELAQVELRRAQAQGFTEAEFNEARVAHLSSLRNQVERIGTRSARLTAEHILESATRDRAWQKPSDALAEAEAALQSSTPADLLAAFNALFPVEQTQTLVFLPEKFRPPTTEDVADVLDKARERRLRGNAGSDEVLAFAYTSFDKPGKVASRSHVSELKIDLLRLDNQVRVNLLPMVSDNGRFHLTARIGRGTADVPADRPGIARLAAGILEAANLGRHPTTEITRLLELRGVNRRVLVVDDQAVITFNGPSSELTFVLQLLTAMLTDLRPVPEAWPHYLGWYNSAHLSTTGTPPGVARVNAIPLLANQDRRLGYPVVQYVAQYPFKEVSDWLRGSWLRGPVEIGIVGHFLPETLIDPIRETVGTLPRRKDGEIQTKERLTTSTQPGRIQLKFEGGAGSTASYVQWPVTLTASPRQGAAVVLASDILEDRVRRLLREKFGATYTPMSGLYRHATQRDHAAIWIALTLAPQEDQNMTGWVMFVADELARNGASEDELLRVAEPRRTAHARDVENPAWWLETVVSRAHQDPSAIPEAIAKATAWEQTTLADVNAAARQLVKERVLVVIVTPEDGAAQKAK